MRASSSGAIPPGLAGSASRRSLVTRLAVVGLLVAALVLVSPCGASAAPEPSPWPTACSADLDVATCERATYIADQAAQLDDAFKMIGWGVGILLVVACAPVLLRTFGRRP